MEYPVRFDLRLHGRTKDGQPCIADITVYAGSSAELQQEAKKVSEDADWVLVGTGNQPVPEGSSISVERVEKLN